MAKGKDETVNVIKTALHINERLQPEDRIEYYEKHLQGIFKKEKIGNVIGGKSNFFKDGAIASCELNIECFEGQLARLVEILHNIPMAKGSKLTLFRGTTAYREYSLGNLEGMAIYLDGVSLPADVYKSCNVNHVVDEVFRLLETPPILYSYFQGPTETALYFYSTSFTVMRTKINNLLLTYPLCKRCRVTQIS